MKEHRPVFGRVHGVLSACVVAVGVMCVGLGGPAAGESAPTAAESAPAAGPGAGSAPAGESAPPDLAGMHMAANDLCGQEGLQDHLVSGEGYTYALDELDASLAPADASARTVAFGAEVVLRYEGLRPAAQYKLRVTYLSNGPRVESLQAGAKMLQERLELAKGPVRRFVLDVPVESYADGKLELKFARISGPNAVVSGVELWCSQAGAVSRPATAHSQSLDELLAAYLPRLTPAPASVAGVGPMAGGLAGPRVSLCGTWRFHPAPPAHFQDPASPTADDDGWADIQVPGEWACQGFVVAKDQSAGYRRPFALPADWSGKRIKLRCDAVYSDATVWVNGRQAGRHEGGFTPFELDVTDLVRPGEANTIALAVRNESLADTLASGTQYAAHCLGGIPRKMYLFPVGEVSLASLHVETMFDKDFADATLRIGIEVANEGPRDAAGLRLVVGFQDAQGHAVTLAKDVFDLPAVAGNKTQTHALEVPVPRPHPWNAEQPYLYTLSCRLEQNGRELQTNTMRIGFRQVEVRGREVFVNGRPIKLHGVCRHETHPLLGRSLTDELWQADAALFRGANCNFIRTSHYPPAEEFIQQCDEQGLFVEEESPLCWIGHGANPVWAQWNCHDPKFLPTILSAVLSTLQRDRSHPSVILWSLANESLWGPNFRTARQVADLLDPTRPKTFHDQGWGSYNNKGSNLSVGNYHYPGPAGPQTVRQFTRPYTFGEYCHLQTYNRRELVSDPGVRDFWGLGFAPMWEAMYAEPGVLGGSIWAGIDDIFHVAATKSVGYGGWGVIDGWRRPKPEYWHVKKAYSPTRLLTRSLTPPRAGAGITLEIANRYDFTNLREIEIVCAFAGKGQAGSLGLAGADFDWGNLVIRRQVVLHADIPPRSQGTVTIPPDKVDPAAESLLVLFRTRKEKMIDAERLWLRPRADQHEKEAGGPASAGAARSTAPAGGKLDLVQTEQTITARGANVAWVFDAKTGLIRQGQIGGRTVLAGGPVMMVLPLMGGPCATEHSADIPPYNDTLSDWQATSVTAKQTPDGGVEVLVAGRYKEAAGSYTMRVDAAGGMELDYRFEYGSDVNPRQSGMVFLLPAGFDRIGWSRRAQWSVYPADQIGRPAGTARAFPEGSPIPKDLRIPPRCAWSLDCLALGSNDFRATRANILRYTLGTADGLGVTVRSDGRQAARSWIDGPQVRMLVAGFNTGGGEPFFASHLQPFRRPLHKGSLVEDTIRLALAMTTPMK